MHASTDKHSFSVLSATEESSRASISRPRAKHEISALSTAAVFSQAQRMIGAKLKSTYLR
ncbi:hypothetical protein GmHk_13G036375 [Glycine max]|nr:hypothetical protein GmHk_13G036375 [Glycine max]